MTYFPLAKRRRRLTIRFKPIVDGLVDKARARAALARDGERESLGGQWSQTQPGSFELEVIENTSGSPFNLLGRIIDCAHRGEIQSVALIAVADTGVIHTAWSDGDLDLMSRAASFLADDLQKASERA